MSIVAIDGKCMLAKAAFAVPSSVKSPSGHPVNGLLGFGLMELRLLEEYPSATFAVTFDSGQRSFRDQLFSGYKNGRPDLPVGFEEQLELAKTFSRLIGCHVIETPIGFEADDVLASLARQAQRDEQECFVITADKDLLQVVRDPLVRVLLSRRGASDYDVYDETLVRTRWGVPPSSFVDLRALTGDQSDGIPGVPGVGVATARMLVSRFGGVEEILGATAEIGGSLEKRLVANAGVLRRNLQLIRLASDLPVVLKEGPPTVKRWHIEEIREFVATVGLAPILRKIDTLVGQEHSGMRKVRERISLLPRHVQASRRLLVVGCAAHKGGPGLAAEIYVSPVFRKSRAYAERYSHRWFVVSAKHGLLSPEAPIEPYDVSLSDLGLAERDRWRRAVCDEIAQKATRLDAISMLAADDYALPLADGLRNLGYRVSAPMDGMTSASRVEWLNQQMEQPRDILADLERFYDLVDRLRAWAGGPYLLRDCDGRLPWPRRGVYFFREPNESRLVRTESRVTRVGTHGVASSSRSTLWSRLRTHRGIEAGGGHRASVFRLHVGGALLHATGSRDSFPTWGAASGDRTAERPLEAQVSAHIGAMEVVPLAVDDEPGPRSDRAFIEANAIALLAAAGALVDPPMPTWLGLKSAHATIRRSGLWNVDHVGFRCDPAFLDVLDAYVRVTLREEAAPGRRLAPRGWWLARRRVAGQGSLFAELL